VSTLSAQSELRRGAGLKGCRKKSRRGCAQWKTRSPYEDDEFVCEGYKKKKKERALYMNGSGCPDGNKCLDSHKGRWDENLPENKNVMLAKLKAKRHTAAVTVKRQEEETS
jgi:hypothetical protein